ncbi:MAG: peptide ABC transporter substrate-binding protein [Myxococcales bacterium]|nr:peptide ABC transporter substrate-binding protein [Myxococcales bacterium]MCB9536398.1 peptide ABC transporter substrate-binding protein [Myxococcales bacterium]
MKRPHLLSALAPAALCLTALSAMALGGCKSEPKTPATGTAKAEQKAGAAGEAPKAADKVDTSLRKERNPRIFNRSLGEPEYLDPGLCSESEGGIVTHDTFEGLYVYGPSHKVWTPGVAKSHTVSEDGLTWTFELRHDSKWSDGKPVTAHDFEWSWKRVLDPKTASRYAEILWFIKGAREYNLMEEGADADALRAAVGVKAKDDYTLEVQLVGPTPFFIQLTAFYTYAPVPRHVIEKHGDKWARPENIVSNGPWHVTEWKSRQSIKAEANPHYWDKANMPFDQINYLITEDNATAYTMYQAGDLDYIDSKVPEAVLPRLRKERDPELETNPYLGVYFYMFNVKEKPFDDVRVRRALNLAVDKSQIGKFVVKGGQEEAWTIVHPGLEEMGYPMPEGPEYDPDLAKKLLAEAGFPDGKGFPTFQISYNTLEGHKLIAQFIQQQWKKNLGVVCDLDNMEWKVLLKKQHERDFQVSRSSWIGDYLDPFTFLSLWEGPNPNNRTNWAQPTYDKLMADARVETDAQKRMQMLADAEKIFIDEVPAMPIYFYVKQDLVRPWLKGYTPHLQGVHLARHLRVEL